MKKKWNHPRLGDTIARAKWLREKKQKPSGQGTVRARYTEAQGTKELTAFLLKKKIVSANSVRGKKCEQRIGKEKRETKISAHPPTAQKSYPLSLFKTHLLMYKR